MLFQSQAYVLIFLPLVAAVYYLSARSLVLRQWVLIAASLVFYAWWDWRFLVLPVAQIAVTWALSHAHGRTGRSGFLHAGVVLNLASLGTVNGYALPIDGVGTLYLGHVTATPGERRIAMIRLDMGRRGLVAVGLEDVNGVTVP